MAINQYKDGIGVNDHKKGNRTSSKRNTERIQALNKAYKEEIDGYKAFAEKRRESVKVKQEDACEYLNRLLTYIEECSKEEKPISRAGIILTLGVSRDTYDRMKVGELDYRLEEYICINSIREEDASINDMGIPYVKQGDKDVLLIPYSQIIEKAELILERETEERLYKSGRVGDIFSLKALHGWKEDNSPHTVNQTLVLASPEQARKAIELLK